MKKIAIALHSLVLGPTTTYDPTKPEPFELDDKQFNELLAMGAIREANDAEVLFWKQRNRPVQPAAKPVEVETAKPVEAEGTESLDSDQAKVRAALEARATELGVKFNKNLSSTALAARIAEAEAAQAKQAEGEAQAETKLDI